MNDRPVPWTDELALALGLADRADAITMELFRSASLLIDRKPDRTEVTEADRRAESVIRQTLRDVRPDHAVLGEEEGLVGPLDAEYRWIIDPIDGTSNYVKGIPIWATLIALECRKEIVVGVVSAPALGRRWWASQGNGAFADGHPIQVSTVATLAEAHLSHAGVASFFDHGTSGDALVLLSRQVWRERALGDFWMHVLVAEGAFDIAVEAIVNLWDLAALKIIVEEAGGRFTDLSGRATPDGGSALSSNGVLHQAVLDALGART